MVKQPPCICAADSLPRARLLGQLAELARDLVDVLAVGLVHHRHDEAVRRVGGKADVEVLLQDQVGARWDRARR